MINVNKKYQFIVYIFFCGLAQAQMNDNFSDGDFTSNPTWSGSTHQFIINSSEQLQLNNSSAGTSYLSTPWEVSTLDNMEWQAWVKQTFSPSANNFSRLYLVSNQPDLTQPLNGYYLQFGEAGANDAIELFRQTGSASTSVCRATNGAIASPFNVRVDVLRNPSGQWSLRVDYLGGTDFKLEATGTDSTYRSSSFFGIVCAYTVSNETRFYYDDFYAGPLLADTSPRELQSVQVTSSHTISLRFSEALDRASAESVDNYFANNSLGNPQSASLQSDSRTVNLTFTSSFLNGVQNQLTVSGVKDLTGNIMNINQLQFSFLQVVVAQPKDIVITEIFPDPTPQIGLPDAEFIEIYNRSPNPLDLSGWTLSDAVSSATFPSEVILPMQYWIITSSSEAPKFNSFGYVVGLPGFPTLNNDGDTLTLKNAQGATIDSVNYSLDWYHDADKQQGGWSLEMIDLSNPCGGSDNWIASEDPQGGTPGKQNSVNASKPDVIGPRLMGVVPVQPNQLLVTFDKQLDKSLPPTGSFILSPSLSASKLNFADQALLKIQLTLSTSLQFRELYTLKVENIYDCHGNLIQDEFSQLDFALPEPADSLDILINEVLFNPRPNGVDFVEVYNNSAKYINLNNWKLSHFENGIPVDVERITSTEFTLSPHAYLVFTAKPDVLESNYPMGLEKNFFQINLPSLPDDEGSIALLNDQGRIIDFFLYTQGFHSRLLKDDEGVSLERISFSNPTNEAQNWESASSQIGFATPGYLNSCARPENPVMEGSITIEPEIFAPNSVAVEFARINYKFGQPGFVANIEILDPQGHSIKTIARSETLGTEGFFRWDGDRDDGRKARIGYYLVRVEVFDFAGTIKTFRKRVVVATR